MVEEVRPLVIAEIWNRNFQLQDIGEWRDEGARGNAVTCLVPLLRRRVSEIDYYLSAANITAIREQVDDVIQRKDVRATNIHGD